MAFILSLFGQTIIIPNLIPDYSSRDKNETFLRRKFRSFNGFGDYGMNGDWRPRTPQWQSTKKDSEEKTRKPFPISNPLSSPNGFIHRDPGYPWDADLQSKEKKENKGRKGTGVSAWAAKKPGQPRPIVESRLSSPLPPNSPRR